MPKFFKTKIKGHLKKVNQIHYHECSGPNHSKFIDSRNMTADWIPKNRKTGIFLEVICWYNWWYILSVLKLILMHSLSNTSIESINKQKYIIHVYTCEQHSSSTDMSTDIASTTMKAITIHCHQPSSSPPTEKRDSFPLGGHQIER